MEGYEEVSSGASTGSLIVSLIICVLLIVAYWKIFTKASVPGWMSLIPFVNTYQMFKIVWGNGWLFLLLLVPIVDIVVDIMYCNKLSKAFGHGIGFTLGLIFLKPIFVMILGFGSDQYIGPQ